MQDDEGCSESGYPTTKELFGIIEYLQFCSAFLSHATDKMIELTFR